MTIDWGAIHHRLESAARGTARSAAEIREILRSRALVLAQTRRADDVTDESIEILEFRLADENYGIGLTHLREVFPFKAYAPVPGAPPFVFGIINVRGRIVSVIDLKKFFGLPDKGLSNLNKVIIVRSPVLEIGILADAVTGIRSIPIRHIQPSLPTLTGIRVNYLAGVTRERLVLMDAAKLLADRGLIVHETVNA